MHSLNPRPFPLLSWTGLLIEANPRAYRELLAKDRKARERAREEPERGWGGGVDVPVCCELAHGYICVRVHKIEKMLIH